MLACYRTFAPSFCLAAFVIMTLASSAFAQPSHYPENEQWYNYTDDGHQQYVYEMGHASSPDETVVVLHGGWGAEHSYLLDPLAPLAGQHRFVFYDQRGSLRSPAADSTISLDRLVDDLDDLRQALKLQKMTLLAHSMGNALAYAYLDRYPERVQGLVLVAPVHPSMFTNGPNLDFVRSVWPEADSTAMVDAMSQFFQDWENRAYGHMEEANLVPDSLQGARPQEVIGVLTDRDRSRAWRITFASVNSCTGDRWKEMQGGQIFYNQRVANALMSDPVYVERAAAFWPALQAFQGPVSVLVGTCDYVDVGPMLWPHLVNALPSAEISVLEGAGHSIWMDRPEAFERAVSEALSRISERGSAAVGGR